VVVGMPGMTIHRALDLAPASAMALRALSLRELGAARRPGEMSAHRSGDLLPERGHGVGPASEERPHMGRASIEPSPPQLVAETARCQRARQGADAPGEQAILLARAMMVDGAAEPCGGGC